MTFKKYTTLCFILSAVVLFSGCANSFSPVSTVEAAGPVFTKKSFIGQVGPIPDTTLLTPTADGDYRVSIYLSAPKPANPGVGSIEVALFWTDENGLFTPGGNDPFVADITLLDGSMQRQSTFTLHVKAGTDIKVTGSPNTTDTLNKYDVFIVVEPLQ